MLVRKVRVTPELYLRHGFSILPLRPGEKRPIGPWRHWTAKPMTIADARAWWARTPAPGIGIIAGRLSGVTVLDIEPEHAERFRSLEIPRGAGVVRTARGGYHVYCRHAGERNRKLVVDGVTIGDVRGEGGYVVGPPTRTPAGEYQWLTWPDRKADVPAWAAVKGRTSQVGGVGPRDRDPLTRNPAGRPDTPNLWRPSSVSALLERLPSRLLTAMTGWLPGGSFPSRSELHYALAIEVAALGGDVDLFEALFAEVPVLAGHVVARHSSYLVRTFEAGAQAYEAEAAMSAPATVAALSWRPGRIEGGARKRALFDLDVEGQSVFWTIPVVLGPPRDGAWAGEWLAATVAFGFGPELADFQLPEARARIVFDGLGRVRRLIPFF